MYTRVAERSGHGRLTCAKGAFTLIEVLAVMTIIVILMGLLVVGINNADARARREKTVALIQKVQTAVQNYYAERKRFPVADSSADPRNVLLQAAVELAAWKGGNWTITSADTGSIDLTNLDYEEVCPDDLRDAWGHPLRLIVRTGYGGPPPAPWSTYVYIDPASNEPFNIERNGVQIYSVGPDGLPADPANAFSL